MAQFLTEFLPTAALVIAIHVPIAFGLWRAANAD